MAELESRCKITIQPPSLIYKVVRNIHGTMTSTPPVHVQVQPSTAMMQAIVAKEATIVGTIRRFDLKPLEVFVPQAATSADIEKTGPYMAPILVPQKQAFDIVVPSTGATIINIYVRRKLLPLSCAYAGAPLVLAFALSASLKGLMEVVCTQPFVVVAKESRSGKEYAPKTTTKRVRGPGLSCLYSGLPTRDSAVHTLDMVLDGKLSAATTATITTQAVDVDIQTRFQPVLPPRKRMRALLYTDTK